MQLYNGVDSATPGSPLPKGTTLLFGYVGAPDLSGKPDTPHVWTLADWNQYMSPDGDHYGGPNLRVIPVYTHDYPGNPNEDARNAVDACADLGWDLHVGRLIYWDAELLVDEKYTDELAQCIHDRGMRMGKYGSLSTIESDPPVPGGTWFAAWRSEKPTTVPIDKGVAWQWSSPEQNHTPWDMTVARAFVYDNAGRSIRHIDD